ncbi:MAG: 3-methyl-2-oxobutanoate hydroxymethyltransferase [Albidovulum sp.]|nr:3-methyl-2-oxobutanoate hydroxymethyltransferase [Albidovulum sp.]
MKRVYTWAARPSERTVTVASLRQGKGSRKWTQVTANSEEEAVAADEAGIDMIICNSLNAERVRSANTKQFMTAALGITHFPTESDIIREAFRVLDLGADAVMTARSTDIVRALAKEDIPVMGHLGLVPRKSTWTDGLRAIGKTGREAFELYRKFKRLEEAGGVLVEAEVIPGPVMAEISKRSGLITVSLGSGSGGDVDYLFMEDICGDSENPPRHARAFGNLAALREKMHLERVNALRSFRAAAEGGKFPGKAETPDLEPEELDRFMELLERKDG